MSNTAHNAKTDPPKVLQYLSSNLRGYRQQAGLSQMALAELSGVSRRMLAGIEAGDRNVSLAVLDKIAAALTISFTDLIRIDLVVPRRRAAVPPRSWPPAAGTLSHSAAQSATFLAKARATAAVRLAFPGGDALHRAADGRHAATAGEARLCHRRALSRRLGTPLDVGRAFIPRFLT